MRLEELERQIGYIFEDKDLLQSALMHSSYTNEKRLPKYKCNERLEFLGDAVLELVSSEYIFGANEFEGAIETNQFYGTYNSNGTALYRQKDGNMYKYVNFLYQNTFYFTIN